MITDPSASGKPVIPPHILWPGLVIGLLLMSLGICATTVVLATGDPSVAIEPAYYERALAWDADRAGQAASDALGWTCAIEVDARADPVGWRTIIITLTSAAGPVEGADLSVEAFPHARAGQRRSVAMTPTGPGRYQGAIHSPRPGWWTFAVRAQRRGDVFIVKERMDIAPAEAR